MYCRKCANRLSRRDQFCRNCGTKVVEGKIEEMNENRSEAEKAPDNAETSEMEASVDLDRFFSEDIQTRKKFEKIEEKFESLTKDSSAGEEQVRFTVFNMEDEQESDNVKEEMPMDAEKESEEDIEKGVAIVKTPEMIKGEGEKAEAFDELFSKGYDKKNNEKKSSTFGKFISAILAICVLLAVCVAICYIWPNSAISFFDKIGIDVSWLQAENPVVPDTDTPVETPKPAGEPDRTIPVNDKSEIIAAIGAKYTNLKTFSWNGGLGYNSAVKYATTDIQNSKPLSTNLWYQENGVKYYYDEAIIEGIALYNSKWIDYINDGDRGVFEMINLEGKAAKDALGFKNKGLTEEFKLLEIGEIRENKGDFYVWTHELINATKNNRTETKEYNWIYKMKAKGKCFSVDGYYRY